jgi:hypothetical protein
VVEVEAARGTMVIAGVVEGVRVSVGESAIVAARAGAVSVGKGVSVVVEVGEGGGVILVGVLVGVAVAEAARSVLCRPTATSTITIVATNPRSVPSTAQTTGLLIFWNTSNLSFSHRITLRSIAH